MTSTVPYFVRVLDKIHYKLGTWHGLRVGVFRRENDSDVQVGEYERNYPSLFHTFAPFHAGGRDLALYSPHYTCTRLLELPSCRDIGGEEPHSLGFCPTDFFVPYFIDLASHAGDQPSRRRRKQLPTREELAPRTIPVTYTYPEGRIEYHHEAPIGPLTYHPFGFVAGCVWGDDSSWKLQYLDLSQAAVGVLRREERFGYVELPDNLRLEKAIDLIDYRSDSIDDSDHEIGITLTKRFNLRTGRVVDPLV